MEESNDIPSSTLTVPLLHQEVQQPRLENIKSLTYRFNGKFTLFPIILLTMSFCSGILISRGSLGYTEGYFKSDEVYYGIAGLSLFFITVFLIISVVRWVMIAINIKISRRVIIITKSGLLRSSELRFETRSSDVFFYRSHHRDSKAWLQLVVCENDVYYRIASWKGSGIQKKRFFKFFTAVFDEVGRAKNIERDPNADTHLLSAEIVGRTEIQWKLPFSSRLARLDDVDLLRSDYLNCCVRQGIEPSIDEQENLQLIRQSLRVGVRCLTDLTSRDLDLFFGHFSYSKLPGDPPVKTRA